MTIDELIEKLARYPGHWRVIIDGGFGYDYADYVSPGLYREPTTDHPYMEFEYQTEGKYIDLNAVAIS